MSSNQNNEKINYEKIRMSAEQSEIDLERSWIVWSLDLMAVVLCGKGEQKGFCNPTEAFDWARRHDGLKKLAVTGPHGRYVELEDSDRYPTLLSSNGFGSRIRR